MTCETASDKFVGWDLNLVLAYTHEHTLPNVVTHTPLRMRRTPGVKSNGCFDAMQCYATMTSTFDLVNSLLDCFPCFVLDRELVPMQDYAACGYALLRSCERSWLG